MSSHIGEINPQRIIFFNKNILKINFAIWEITFYINIAKTRINKKSRDIHGYFSETYNRLNCILDGVS